MNSFEKYRFDNDMTVDLVLKKDMWVASMDYPKLEPYMLPKQHVTTFLRRIATPKRVNANVSLLNEIDVAARTQRFVVFSNFKRNIVVRLC